MGRPTFHSGGVLLALLMLAGCHHGPYGPAYYQSGPYAPGPAYGPTMMPVPQGGYPPQGGYISPGPTYTPQNLSPTPFQVNPGSPTPINPSSPSAPTWRPDPNAAPSGNTLDDAPPFKPNPGSGGNLVPNPLEPDFSSPPGAALPRARPVNVVEATPFRPTTPVSNQTANVDPFEEPRQVPSLPTEADPFAPNAPSPVVNRQNPYGYDGSSYSWLRGIVDFDDVSQTWSIIYNLTPEPRDQFGGSFVFAPHESQKNLKSGSLVLVKGRADPGRTDNRGKPLYEVAQLVVLSPPTGIQ